MKNSQVITVLTIFILVFSVATIALTLEGSYTVFAAKKSKSEDKPTTKTGGETSTSSNGADESNNGDGGGSGTTFTSLSVPCPDGSIPVKGNEPIIYTFLTLCVLGMITIGITISADKEEGHKVSKKAVLSGLGIAVAFFLWRLAVAL